MRAISELLSYNIRGKLGLQNTKMIEDLWNFLNTDEGRQIIGFNNELLTEIVFHTTIHCENLLQILSRLNEKANLSSNLSPSSLFLLIISLLIHDAGISLIIGAGDTKVKVEGLMNHSLRELRKKHAERFSEWFKANKTLLLEKKFLTEDEIPIIEFLGKYHSKSTSSIQNLEKELSSGQVKLQDVQVKHLLSILRLTDACDVNRNRVTERHKNLRNEYIKEFNKLMKKRNKEVVKTIKDNIKFLQEQESHYKKHLHFYGTFFEKNEKNELVIILVPSLDKIWQEMLSIFGEVKKDIEDELEVEEGVVRKTLQEIGISFSEEYVRLLNPLKDYSIMKEVYKEAYSH